MDEIRDLENPSLAEQVPGDTRQRARRIVKIAPGDNARFWEECLRGGFICIGWDRTGDLSGYGSEREFMEAFRALYPDRQPSSGRELWWLRDLQPGDLIIANHGGRQILGIGTVTRPGVHWDDSRSEYKHLIYVDWDTSVAREVNEGSAWRRTVRQLSEDQFLALVPEYEDRLGDDAGHHRAWLFQGRPDRYDLPGALAELNELTWDVNQYPKQIHLGDRVYLWETGEEAGVLALGTIITDPEVRPDEQAERRFWRTNRPPEGDRLRVRVKVDRLVQPRLSRSMLVTHPILASLPNLRFANATNFRLTPEQDDALWRAILEKRSERNYFIAMLGVDFPGTWETTKQLGQWGAQRADSIARSVAPGDRAVIRIARQGFKALVEFTSAVHEVETTEETDPWQHPGRKYPYRFDFRLLKEYPVMYNPAFPAGENKDLGLKTLQMQPVVRIEKRTYEHIVSELERLNSGPEIGDEGKRSREFWLVAYFLARCGVSHPGQPSGPPAQLGTDLWHEAYDLFYARLGGGRASDQFRNSMKNARDLYDAHLSVGGRVGWRSEASGAPNRPAQPLPAKAAEVEQDWRERSDAELWEEVRRFVDGQLPASNARIPEGFDWALFQTAVDQYREAYSTHADPHPIAQRQLAAWLASRHKLSDEELWAGLRERFFRYGHLTIGGQPYGEHDTVPMSQRELDEADRAGRVQAAGNLHWTTLQRGAGRAKGLVPQVRAAIDYLLDEQIPYADRLEALVGGDRKLPGLGAAHWTALHAMATDWQKPVLNGTVEAAFTKLKWPLPQFMTADRLEQLWRRTSILLESSGLGSLAALDRVFWNVVSLDSPDTFTAPSDRPVGEIVRGAVAAGGLAFTDDVADNLYLSLRAKPFVILSGLSGTGKTKLAIRMCELLCDEANWVLVPVRPDWSDSRGLLGFLNLLTARYQATPLMRLLIRAQRDWNENEADAGIYGVVLDEMNLARVEHYFAEYLSAMESRRLGDDGSVISEPVLLHDESTDVLAAGEDESDGLRVPSSLELPPNFFVVGTVNVDETTQPFSRKVLDRANTIELFDVDLRLEPPDDPPPVTPGDRERIRRHFSRDGAFLDLTQPALEPVTMDLLVDLNTVLEPYRMHFGYRVRNEILRFVGQAGDELLLGMLPAASETARDLQILQKVLPKLSGSRDQLQRPLRGLLQIAFGEDGVTLSGIGDRYEELYARLGYGSSVLEPSVVADAQLATTLPPLEPRFPRTARKLTRMLLELKSVGYSSFFE